MTDLIRPSAIRERLTRNNQSERLVITLDEPRVTAAGYSEGFDNDMLFFMVIENRDNLPLDVLEADSGIPLDNIFRITVAD